METVLQYRNRIVVVKQTGEHYFTFLRRNGAREDFDLETKHDSKARALEFAKEFIDGIPQLDSWPV